MRPPDQPVVLIVEDDPDIAETYELWLAHDHDIRRAADGVEALAQLDETVDVVLLDRMMPRMSGDEVLEEIRARDVDCRVAMVTAVDPSFDIIEMGFDEYITKPPSKGGLRDAVKRLLDRATLDEDLQTYYSLVARRSALEAEKSLEELEASEEYAALLERIEAARATVDEGMGDMGSDADFIGSIREIMGGTDASVPDSERRDSTQE